MKIPAHGIEAFLALARLKSFTRAAGQLGLTQSAFSQRILTLEQTLETSLFLRARAGTKLTEAGESLLRYAQTLEALEEEYLGSQESLPSSLRGTIRIGAFSSVGRSLLLPALGPLLRENEVHCEVKIREMGELPGLLQNGEADVILVTQEIPRSGLVAQFLGFEENVLVRAKKRKKTGWYLDHNSEDSTTERYLRGSSKKNPQRRFFDDVYLLIDAVKLGMGEAVIPKHLLDADLEVESGGKVLREPIWMIHPEQAYYPKLQERAFADIAQEFKKRLPQK